MPQHDYIADLEGHPADLELLAHCFSDDRCKVFKNGGVYQMTSPEFRLHDNPERVPVKRGEETEFVEFDKNYEDVRDRATAILHAMIGAARLVRSEVDQVRVPVVRKWTLEGHEVGASGWAAYDPERSGHSLPAERAGLPALMRAYVTTGLNDEAVQTVLQIYAGLPISWSRCVLIIEEVASDCGGLHNLEAFIGKKALSRLTQSAHKARNIEEGPRHGGKVSKDWNPAEAMTLMEADSTVKGIVVRWLAKKTGAGQIPQ
jgi:hypothetical protein